MFLVIGIVIGDKEMTSGSKTNDTGPFTADQLVKRRGSNAPGFATVRADGQRHVPVDLGVLATDAEEVAVARNHDGGVPPALRPPVSYQVFPLLFVAQTAEAALRPPAPRPVESVGI